MKQMTISKIHRMVAYDKNDYFENNKKINDDCLTILKSHERNNPYYDTYQAREYLEDLNSNLYFDLEDAQIYILYRYDLETKIDEPVGLSIFDKIEKTNSWILELIFTHYDYTQMGIATALLRYSVEDLRDSKNAEEINSTVNKQNFASLNLNQSFGKVKGVKTIFDERHGCFAYHFDIKNMDLKSTRENADEFML